MGRVRERILAVITVIEEVNRIYISVKQLVGKADIGGEG